jgi:hypothetical protein
MHSPPSAHPATPRSLPAPAAPAAPRTRPPPPLARPAQGSRHRRLAPMVLLRPHRLRSASWASSRCRCRGSTRSSRRTGWTS